MLIPLSVEEGADLLGQILMAGLLGFHGGKNLPSHHFGSGMR
jgi:hypothetical protein